MCMQDSIYDCDTYIGYFSSSAKHIDDIELNILGFLDKKDYLQIRVPSLIKGEVLERCGYFETFPQHLTAVCSIKDEEQSKVTLKNIDESKLKYHKHYLTPAACIHIYPMLQNKLDKINSCYTFHEKVYRYENGNYEDKERLWEFSVREFVFVGTPNYVKQMLRVFKQKSLNFATEFDENAELKSASDIFYSTKANKVKERLQLANDLKTELKMDYDGRKIAVASFNYHGEHFSKPFNFDANGSIVTGCVGFGLDRWALCTLDRYKDL